MWWYHVEICRDKITSIQSPKEEWIWDRLSKIRGNGQKNQGLQHKVQGYEITVFGLQMSSDLELISSPMRVVDEARL